MFVGEGDSPYGSVRRERPVGKMSRASSSAAAQPNTASGILLSLSQAWHSSRASSSLTWGPQQLPGILPHHSRVGMVAGIHQLQQLRSEWVRVSSANVFGGRVKPPIYIHVDFRFFCKLGECPRFGEKSV